MAKIINFVVHHIGLQHTIRSTVVGKMRDTVTGMIQTTLTKALEKEQVLNIGNNLSIDLK